MAKSLGQFFLSTSISLFQERPKSSEDERQYQWGFVGILYTNNGGLITVQEVLVNILRWKGETFDPEVTK